MTDNNVVSPAYTMPEAIEYTKSMAFQHNMASASFRISDCLALSHGISCARGWWWDKDKSEPKFLNIGERYALMHSELSEGLEGVRTGALSEKLNNHFTNEEEELADLLHRIFDYACAKSLRLGDAFVAKAAYNLHRKDHGLEARAETGGKKF